ncbi:protein dispatched homolog 1 [Nematolebias whitei]|uniref:protein dispatched homolog 1 n=1 Tax=Nematolebias whitei TaxID=451745 RepID=UPI001896C583|nr:protein dispatched homolog 1 [Nematolebias whitei]
MALSDADGDPPSLSNGGPHPLSTNRTPPSCSSQDPPSADESGVQPPHVERPSQNGSVLQQNGSLRNLPPPSAASPSPAVKDPQSPARHPLPSTLPPPSSFCCPHCHLRSTLCCPCGQQECPLFQSLTSDPHQGTVASCPPCLSTCTYSHPHHPSSPASLHHHQRLQEHLQSPIQVAGIR